MEQILACENTSSSSMYGCVGYAIQDYILRKCEFPDDLFNSVTISTELASRNIRRSFRSQNTNIEMSKRVKPYIVIQPSYPTMEYDMPMQGIPLTANFDDLQYRTDARYLFDILKDYDNGYCVKFKMNRSRIEFDITMVFDTLHRQLDIRDALRNRLKWENSGIVRVALESIIPKKLVAYMSKLSHMDLETSPDYIPIFLQHLNKVSAYPVTYKMRNASATDEWFFYYTHNIVVSFTELSADQGQRKNMTEDEYRVTFRAIVDFNYPAVYFVDVIPDRTIGLDLSIKTVEYNSNSSELTPIFSIPNLFSRYPNERNGKQLYGSSIFRTDVKDPRMNEDRVNMKGILSNDHIRVIRAHRSWHMPMETLVDIVILKNRQEQVQDKDYYIDWNTLDIVIKKPDNNATYRLVMYFDFNIFNDILNNSDYHNFYDTDKLEPNVISQTNPEPMRVIPIEETKPEETPDEDIAKPDDISGEEVIPMTPVEPKPKTADIDNKKKIIDLINQGASVAEIHNTIQQEKVHEKQPPLPYPDEPSRPEVIYDMQDIDKHEPNLGKKRFSSTAK